jgi:hypothetical protein
MANEETLISVALKTWAGNPYRANNPFSNLSSEELEKEVAPGRNRLIYLWGHLAATHDRMRTLLGLGERLRPEFDVLFLTTPDEKVALPPAAEIKKCWDEVNRSLSNGFATFSVRDWLQKHTAVSAEDFAEAPLRNRFSILLSRTGHLSHHLGQAILTR